MQARHVYCDDPALPWADVAVRAEPQVHYAVEQQQLRALVVLVWVECQTGAVVRGALEIQRRRSVRAVDWADCMEPPGAVGGLGGEVDGSGCRIVDGRGGRPDIWRQIGAVPP